MDARIIICSHFLSHIRCYMKNITEKYENSFDQQSIFFMPILPILKYKPSHKGKTHWQSIYSNYMQYFLQKQSVAIQTLQLGNFHIVPNSYHQQKYILSLGINTRHNKIFLTVNTTIYCLSQHCLESDRSITDDSSADFDRIQGGFPVVKCEHWVLTHDLFGCEKTSIGQ